MEFSGIQGVCQSLLLHLPNSAYIAAVQKNALHVYCLPELSLIGQHDVVTAPSYLASTTSLPHVIAVASETSVTILYSSSTLDDKVIDFASATIHMETTPIVGISICANALCIAHEQALGISVVSLPRLKYGTGTPVQELIAFLPYFAQPRTSIKQTGPIDTLSVSPCERYAALGVKLPAIPGVRIIELKSGTVVAEAWGSEALGGEISEVCGVHWLTKPFPSLFIWGCPRDGPNAFCLLGLDCVLLHSGYLLNASLMSNSPEATEFDDGRARRAETGVDLGIKSIVSSSARGYMAVGMYDGSLQVINIATWRLVADWNLCCPSVDEDFPPSVFLEREKLIPSSKPSFEGKLDENCHSRSNVDERGPGGGQKNERPHSKHAIERASYFEVVDGLGRVFTTRNKPESSSSVNEILRCGVGVVQFSSDGKWLSARNDSSANVVYIISMVHVRLAAVLILRDDVKHMSWTTQQKVVGESDEGTAYSVEDARLSVLTTGESIYLWSDAGVTAVRIPRNLASEQESFSRSGKKTVAQARQTRWDRFRARKVIWTPGDTTAVVLDSSLSHSFCVMYLG